MSKSQANKFNNLIFPSGRTVKDCRNDAKKLKKQALLAGEHLSTSKALDLIAEKNRLPGGWHKAIHSLSQDNTLANITVTHVISPSGAIHSSTIPGVRPSVKDESVKALIDELKPTNIEEGLLRKLDSQRTLRCAVVNEQDEAYRIAVISNVEELHAFHHGMYKLGFYQLTEYFTPEKYRQYQIVFAPDRVIYFQFPEWDSRPFDLTASLLMKLVMWLDYLDCDLPIDNNNDFCNLKKNRPNWTFEMCAIYWKYAQELTGHPLDEEPNATVNKIVQYVSYAAVKRLHTLRDRREEVLA